MNPCPVVKLYTVANYICRGQNIRAGVLDVLSDFEATVCILMVEAQQVTWVGDVEEGLTGRHSAVAGT